MGLSDGLVTEAEKTDQQQLDHIREEAFNKRALLKKRRHKDDKAGQDEDAKRAQEKADAKEKARVAVTESRLIFDMQRTGRDGKARSKGYGFVEFSQHIHALAALRKLNNNPQYTSYAAGKFDDDVNPGETRKRDKKKGVESHPRLIVEFTVENRAKLKIKEKKAESWRQKMSLRAKMDGQHGELLNGGDGAQVSKNRTKKQRKEDREAVKREADWEAEDGGGGKRGGAGNKKPRREAQSGGRKKEEWSKGGGDSEIDSILGETGQGRQGGKKVKPPAKKRKVDHEQAKLDNLVDSYRAKLFSGGASAGGKWE